MGIFKIQNNIKFYNEKIQRRDSFIYYLHFA